jgi:hypothetical protein
MPPNSAIGSAGLVAPEFQIANEPSVAGYVNYMQSVVSKGAGDLKPDYASLMPLSGNPPALLDELNLLLAPMKAAIGSMAAGTDPARLNRSIAAP